MARYVSLSLLVAGFFVQLSHLTIAPMHWLSFVSYPRFAITGLSRLELHGVIYYPPSMSPLLLLLSSAFPVLLNGARGHSMLL